MAPACEDSIITPGTCKQTCSINGSNVDEAKQPHYEISKQKLVLEKEYEEGEVNWIPWRGSRKPMRLDRSSLLCSLEKQKQNFCNVALGNLFIFFKLISFWDAWLATDRRSRNILGLCCPGRRRKTAPPALVCWGGWGSPQFHCLSRDGGTC